MPMTSFAQNREDVLLARVFREPTGFYIDVGAADPVEHSVTKHFYDRGWTGVNVEPQPGLFARLAAARPRDVNLNVAVSDVNGEATFHDMDVCPTRSTLDAGLAESMAAEGITLSHYTRPVRTLTDICRAHADRPIDFLKIDVEGHERQALLGLDLRRWRPRVIVVEATKPCSPEPSHHDWEPIVLAHGYGFAFFDGLNRYYVRHEDEGLIPRLAISPNVFDEFVPFEQVRAVEETTTAYEAALSAERERAAAERERAAVERERTLAAEAATAREHERANAIAVAGQEAVAAERDQTAAVRAELLALRAAGEAAQAAADEKIAGLREQVRQLEAAHAAAATRLRENDETMLALSSDLVLTTQAADLLKSELDVMYDRYEKALAKLNTMVKRSALDAALAVLTETRQHLDTFRAHVLTTSA